MQITGLIVEQLQKDNYKHVIIAEHKNGYTSIESNSTIF